MCTACANETPDCFSPATSTHRRATNGGPLPGGKLEHGETPVDTVRREIREETGYTVEVTRLLGVGSRTHPVNWDIPGGADLHSVGVYYEADITGGTLTAEECGTTDAARWIPVAEVASLERSVLVDIGLDLLSRKPEDGHPLPIRVAWRLRH